MMLSNEEQSRFILLTQQNLSNFSANIWKLIALVDSAYFYIPIAIVIIYLHKNSFSNKGWAMFFGTMVFPTILKVLFQEPRPGFFIDSIDLLSVGGHFGFPSGAAFSTVVIGNIFDRISKNRILKLFWFPFFPFIVGISRFIVGAHFIQDIVGGWIIGLVYFSFYRKIGFRNENKTI